MAREDEEKIDERAKAFLLGLFDGRSRIEIEETPAKADAGVPRKFVVRLFAPN